MAFTGLDLALAIKEGSSPLPRPPWVEHMRVHEENLIQTVEPGRITTLWTPGKQFTVPDGYVQGGLLTAIADGNQWMAIVTTAETLEAWVTLDLHTRFIRPIKGGQPVGIESRVVSKTKTSAVAESRFTLDGEKLAAIVTGGWRKSETRQAAKAED